jgi:hypothetical protein
VHTKTGACSAGDCGCDVGSPARDSLRLVGVGAAATTLPAWPAMAGPFTRADLEKLPAGVFSRPPAVLAATGGLQRGAHHQGCLPRLGGVISEGLQRERLQQHRRYPSQPAQPGDAPEGHVLRLSRGLRIQFPVFPPFATDWAAMDNALIFRSFRAFPPWTQRNPIGPKTGCRVTKAG